MSKDTPRSWENSKKWAFKISKKLKQHLIATHLRSTNHFILKVVLNEHVNLKLLAAAFSANVGELI